MGGNRHADVIARADPCSDVISQVVTMLLARSCALLKSSRLYEFNNVAINLVWQIFLNYRDCAQIFRKHFVRF